MTREQVLTSLANHRKAVKYFNLPKGYVLHHINPDWLYTDVERYIQWNPSDLIVLSKSEHVTLHNKLRDSGFKGKHHSEESKKKLSEIFTQLNTGKHWYTNGVDNKFAFDCPDGYRHGRTLHPYKVKQ